MPFLFGFTPLKVILASLKNKNILNGLKSGKTCILLSLRKMEAASSHCFCVVDSLMSCASPCGRVHETPTWSSVGFCKDPSGFASHPGSVGKIESSEKSVAVSKKERFLCARRRSLLRVPGWYHGFLGLGAQLLSLVGANGTGEEAGRLCHEVNSVCVTRRWL